jgi:Ca2+-binding EF-hand superfamily protein
MDLNKDGKVTKKEAYKAISAWAKSEGIKITKEQWAELEKIFDHVDADKSGDITMAEVETAIWEGVDANGDGEW